MAKMKWTEAELNRRHTALRSDVFSTFRTNFEYFFLCVNRTANY